MKHRSFIPLVMGANGNFRMECKHFYAKQLEKKAEKGDEHYSIVAAWVRRKIMFWLISYQFDYFMNMQKERSWM